MVPPGEVTFRRSCAASSGLASSRAPEPVTVANNQTKQVGLIDAAGAMPADRPPAARGPDDLAALFPSGLIAQEVSTEPYIEIPEPVREIYRMWRPSPLIRARRFEEALNTRARIYVKYEGVSPSGSHKPNTAVPQAFYNKQEGVRRLTTETGAGQWGSARWQR